MFGGGSLESADGRQVKQDSLAKPVGGTKRKLAGAAMLLVVVGVSAWLAIARPNIEDLAVYGYPGLFFIMAVSSASVLLPLPGFATVLAAGTVANPLLIALFAGLGSAVGELTGYLAGYGGKTIIEEKNIRVMKKVEGWLRRHGFIALVAFAAIPNPFFDVVGVVAGSLSYPARRFLLACILGNITKYLILAYLGKTVADFLG